MNESVQGKDYKFDFFKWTVVAVLLLAGIFANSHFANQPMALRLIGWIVLSIVVVLIAFQTTQGRRLWSFFQEARLEVHKVVWPTRQEAIQTTFVVMVMVIITGLCLWGIDSVFLWLVGLLTGQRG